MNFQLENDNIFYNILTFIYRLKFALYFALSTFKIGAFNRQKFYFQQTKNIILLLFFWDF